MLQYWKPQINPLIDMKQYQLNQKLEREFFIKLSKIQKLD